MALLLFIELCLFHLDCVFEVKFGFSLCVTCFYEGNSRKESSSKFDLELGTLI